MFKFFYSSTIFRFPIHTIKSSNFATPSPFIGNCNKNVIAFTEGVNYKSDFKRPISFNLVINDKKKRNSWLRRIGMIFEFDLNFCSNYLLGLLIVASASAYYYKKVRENQLKHEFDDQIK